MKTVILCLLSLLLSSNAFAVTPGKANLGAVASNPAANAVLATTGSLTSGCPSGNGGNYQIDVLVSSTAAAVFDLQALSGGTAVSHTYLMVPANASLNFSTPIAFGVPDNITLQVVNVNAISLGTEQANIYWAVISCN
jgi:hypothetical protein